MNIARLKYEMAIRGVKNDELCKSINMSRSAFYRKCTGKSEFTLPEINAIVEFLNLDSPMEIFFDKKVS